MTENNAELLAAIAELRAENEALKQKKVASLKLKVSEKGAVSLYGIRRFPVTFYRGEWERIIAKGKDIEEFIRQNASVLTVKE